MNIIVTVLLSLFVSYISYVIVDRNRLIKKYKEDSHDSK